jgi:hypothetical protein
MCCFNHQGVKVYAKTVKELVAQKEDYLFTVLAPKAHRNFLLIINQNVYLINRSLFVTNITKFSPNSFPSDANNLSLLDGFLGE